MGKTFEDMKVSRPGYAEIGPDHPLEELKQQWDVVELKYDGIWGRIECDEGVAKTFSRNGQVKHYQACGDVSATLHAEYMFGSNWSYRMGLSGISFVFDCTRWGKKDISHRPLTERREYAAKAVEILGAPFRLVEQYPVNMVPLLWEQFVLAQSYEGLVLKNSEEPFGEGWGRIKRVFEVDYVCMGFNQSDAPKYKGRMVKSVIAGLYDKKGELVSTASVSGLNEHQRAMMFQNPDEYIGRVFKASGKQVFESGALRHPNFVEWHHDKLPTECTVKAARHVGGWGVPMD